MRRMRFCAAVVVLLAACGETASRFEPIFPDPTKPPPVLSSISVVGGDGQQAEVKRTLPRPIVVQVADQYGEPMHGVSVSWAVLSATGAPSSRDTYTGMDGQTQVLWRLGAEPGEQKLIARAGNFAAEVTAHATGVSNGRLTLTPSGWTLPVGWTVPFKAFLDGTRSHDVEWLVNGTPGGDSESGTVTAEGIFTAAQPAGRSIKIRAVSRSDPQAWAEVSVAITAQPETPRPASLESTPRVITPEATGMQEIYLAFTGDMPEAVLEMRDGTRIEFEPWAYRTWRGSVPLEKVLDGYVPGTYRALVGIIFFGTSGSYARVYLNVRDATMPGVTIVPLAPDAQRTEYVLNLYDERVTYDDKLSEVSRLYAFAPDAFDFIGLVDNVERFANRHYVRVRNAVDGIGLHRFDYGSTYKSAARLKGIVSFPFAGGFDLGSGAASHELGHAFIQFLDHPDMIGNGAHYPQSSAASDVMGVSGFNQQGTPFPYDVVPVGSGQYRLACSPDTTAFGKLSLYLMGLIPASDVDPIHIVSPRQSTLACDKIVTGKTITIDEIIAHDGPRVPDHTASQKEFKMATIVLSKGRLLNADEMAFFNHMAARGESKDPLWVASGYSGQWELPFFLATGGRATLVTRMW